MALESHPNSKDGGVYVLNQPPPVIRPFLQYLYTGAVDLQDFQTLAHAYVFAEEILDIGFKNAVLNSIIRRVHTYLSDGWRYLPVHAAINIIYEGTPQHSPARRLMVDLHFFHAKSSWYRDHATEYHPEFLRDLLVKLLEGRHLTREEMPLVCDYMAYHEEGL